MTSIASRFKELYGGRDYEWYRDRIVYMQEFLTEERIDVLCRTVDQRTRYMTILTENTYHPQNASALIRHCEAFGVQDLHTVETRCKFSPNVNIVRGTDKWVDITRHDSTTEAIAALKGAGYRIVATTPHRQSCTPESFDVAKSPFCLVFGTEHAGVSDEIIEALSDKDKKVYTDLLNGYLADYNKDQNFEAIVDKYNKYNAIFKKLKGIQ